MVQELTWLPRALAEVNGAPFVQPLGGMTMEHTDSREFEFGKKKADKLKGFFEKNHPFSSLANLGIDSYHHTSIDSISWEIDKWSSYTVERFWELQGEIIFQRQGGCVHCDSGQPEKEFPVTWGPEVLQENNIMRENVPYYTLKLDEDQWGAKSKSKINKS